MECRDSNPTGFQRQSRLETSLGGTCILVSGIAEVNVRRSNPPMTPTHLDSEIRALIDSFTAKFRELLGLAALGSVQTALAAGVGTPVAPARRGPGRPKGSGRAKGDAPAKRGPGRPPAAKSPTGRRIRRSAEDVEEVAEQIHGYVLAHPGSRLEEIGRGLGTDTAGLKRPIQGLLSTGRLRTEGQKRGTKYFAGGKAAAVKVKAKAAGRKARKATSAKRGQRGNRKAVRQVAIKPAKKGRRMATKAASAQAEPVAAT